MGCRFENSQMTRGEQQAFVVSFVARNSSLVIPKSCIMSPCTRSFAGWGYSPYYS